MLADVEVTLTIPSGELEASIEQLIAVIRTSSEHEDIARSVRSVCPALPALLRSFSEDEFCRALRCMTEPERYEDESGPTLRLMFEGVEYPYARMFADQVATWLTAAGYKAATSRFRGLC